MGGPGYGQMGPGGGHPSQHGQGYGRPDTQPMMPNHTGMSYHAPGPDGQPWLHLRGPGAQWNNRDGSEDNGEYGNGWNDQTQSQQQQQQHQNQYQQSQTQNGYMGYQNGLSSM